MVLINFIYLVMLFLQSRMTIFYSFYNLNKHYYKNTCPVNELDFIFRPPHPFFKKENSKGSPCCVIFFLEQAALLHIIILRRRISPK
jgi:hypothetical protein